MATGLLENFQQYNPTADLTQQSYTADERAVDSTKETVRGQVTDMISKDDPMMQRAAARGTMGAAGRRDRSLAPPEPAVPGPEDLFTSTGDMALLYPATKHDSD